MSYLSAQRRRHEQEQRKFYSMVALVVAGIALILGIGVWYTYGTDQTNTYTVEDKDRVNTGTSGKSEMRVYTEEGDILVIEDTFLRGVWDSADIYAEVEVGETYEFTTYGWRVPFLSMFPTVIEVNDAG